MSALYSQRILDLAAHISHIGNLTAPQASAEAHSRLCGSRVGIEISFKKDKVSDFAQQVSACALGQTACAIVAEHIIGSTAEELHMLAEQMRAMLKEGAPPPEGAKWQDLALLAPVRDYPNRHASTLLIFDAIEDCLEQLNL